MARRKAEVWIRCSYCGIEHRVDIEQAEGGTFIVRIHGDSATYVSGVILDDDETRSIIEEDEERKE